MLNISFLITAVAFVAAIVIHEAAHAYMADRLGDPTARVMGRLSLNPIVHLDVVGSVIVPLFLLIVGSPFIFGWAKPVRFDPFNLENPRRDSALISFAGPASNLILAIISSLILRVGIIAPFSAYSVLFSFFQTFIVINVILAFFNLIPIHPLDGGKVLVGLLPQKEAYEADTFMRKYGIIILILLLFPIFGTSPILNVLGPLINKVVHLLVPGFSTI
jgi:Zn-dependent protease